MPLPAPIGDVFRCLMCSREQQYAPEGVSGGVTTEEAIALGWYQEGNVWFCPFERPATFQCACGVWPELGLTIAQAIALGWDYQGKRWRCPEHRLGVA